MNLGVELLLGCRVGFWTGDSADVSAVLRSCAILLRTYHKNIVA